MKQFDISTLVVTKICDVYGYTLEEETRARATTAHAALILRADGESTYRVGNKTYTASADTLVFLPAGTEYAMEIVREGACTVIELDVAATEQPLPVCEYYTDGEGEMAAMAKNLLLYWKLQGPAYRAKCMSELYALLTQISTIAAEANSLVGKYGLIHKSVKYIERNYRREDLYTPALAAMSGIGETYYRSIFQAVFHMPPARYIQKYRVDKAKELLVASDASMEQIAKATGFAGASYFCKVFKSVTGMTPSEFIEKSRRLG